MLPLPFGVDSGLGWSLECGSKARLDFNNGCRDVPRYTYQWAVYVLLCVEDLEAKRLYWLQ